MLLPSRQNSQPVPARLQVGELEPTKGCASPFYHSPSLDVDQCEPLALKPLIDRINPAVSVKVQKHSTSDGWTRLFICRLGMFLVRTV